MNATLSVLLCPAGGTKWNVAFLVLTYDLALKLSTEFPAFATVVRLVSFRSSRESVIFLSFSGSNLPCLSKRVSKKLGL